MSQMKCPFLEIEKGVKYCSFMSDTLYPACIGEHDCSIFEEINKRESKIIVLNQKLDEILGIIDKEIIK